MSASRLNRWSALLATLSATGLGLYQVKNGIDRSDPLGELQWHDAPLGRVCGSRRLHVVTPGLQAHRHPNRSPVEPGK